MLRRAVKTCLVLVLAAALLCGSLMPPAVRHAHAAGDRPHTHFGGDGQAASHNRTEQRHAHPHGHTHAGHHHEHAMGRDADEGRGRSTAADHVPHLHLTLLWFEVTLPSTQPERSPSDGADFDATLLQIVRLLDDGTLQAAQDSLPRSVEPSTASPAAPRRSPAGRHVAAGLPVATLLCDSARHERSGVQLA